MGGTEGRRGGCHVDHTQVDEAWWIGDKGEKRRVSRLPRAPHPTNEPLPNPGPLPCPAQPNPSQIFRYLLPAPLNRRLATWCRRTGMPFAVFVGRFRSCFVPFQVKLTSVVGRAIRVDAPVPDPSREAVEAMVAEYKREVTRLYYTYRPEDAKGRDLVLLDEFLW